MAHRAPDIFDGVSVEDVVHDAFVAFFDDSDQLGWNWRNGALEPFLWSVVRRRLIDRLRRGGKDSSVDDDHVLFVVEHDGALAANPRDAQWRRDRIEELRILAAGNPQMERLVAACADLEGANVNQQLAAALNTDVKTVENLKRRLRRRVRGVGRSRAHG